MNKARVNPYNSAISNKWRRMKRPQRLMMKSQNFHTALTLLILLIQSNLRMLPEASKATHYIAHILFSKKSRFTTKTGNAV